jgi:4-hydroxymandelate oxidase
MRALTRREAFGRARALMARQRGVPAPERLVPREDLVNTLEFEEQAARRLPPERRALLAGSPRESLDRITLRPRICVPVLDLDLSVPLFGDTHFAPILVGPVADQGRFHPDGELATVRGAGAARAAIVVSSRSTVPLGALAAIARTPLWRQVFVDDPQAAAQIDEAARTGCRAAVVTLDAGSAPALATLVRAASVPEMARRAIDAGAQALVVSNQHDDSAEDTGSPILTLPDIVDVAGGTPVLVDGGFRRGTDIVKALAFGARAVLVSRPVMWGLAAYGAEGVQSVVEMLQTELARYMAMCGKARVSALERSLLRVHRRE